MRTVGLPAWVRVAAPTLLPAGVLVAILAATRGTAPERADFVFNNGAEVTSLDPATVTGLPEARVLAHLFEGLVSQHPETGEPLPGVAESWEVEDDGHRLVFRLRSDALWSNGDPVSAEDFVWSWRRLLDPRTGADYARQLWCVTGARRYTTEVDDRGAPITPWEEVGIRALDAHTLELRLERPVPYLLQLLTFHAFVPVHGASIEDLRRDRPHSWQQDWLRPDHMVVNGPFQLVERRVNDRIRLRKNPRYWDADHVAFRTVDVLAVSSASTALNLYLTGEVDWIERVPPSLVSLMRPREDFAPTPYLATYFYRINTTKPPLDDPRVRRALAMSFSRRAIVQSVTRAGQVPAFGLVPPGIAGYPNPSIERQRNEQANMNRARSLMLEAGYGIGARPLPPIEIHYNTDELHRDIAEVIADSWSQAFAAEVGLLNQEWKVALSTQKSLAYDISRSSWIGDYPDPNSFLEVFVSGGENNRTGWSNPEYDRLIEEAALEQRPPRRMQLLRQAEEILLEELPIIPIYFYVSQNLANPRLGGFHSNIQDVHPPKYLYWRSNAELREERREARLRERGRRIRIAAPGPTEGLQAPAGPSPVLVEDPDGPPRKR